MVFRRGKHLTQEAEEDPAAVPRILERWIDAQQSASEAAQLRDALEHLMLQRLGSDAGTSLVRHFAGVLNKALTYNATVVRRDWSFWWRMMGHMTGDTCAC